MNWQLRRELLTNVAAVMGGGLQAALNLDFTTLTPATMATAGVTFSRASLATQYDSTGKLTYAPNNVTTRSNAFDHADWTSEKITVTADQAVAPDGTTTADLFDDGVLGPNRHVIYQVNTLNTGNVTTSCYVKDVNRRYVVLASLGGNTATAYFDLTLGTVTDSASTLGTSITSVGNGWYRISLTSQVLAGSAYAVLAMSNVDNDGGTLDANFPSYTGSNKQIYAWGMQQENITYETSPRTYNPTTGSAYYGPRFDYNPSTLAAKGLLIEEARTNLMLYSSAFDNAAWTAGPGVTVTADQAVSPDGTTTAEKYIANAHANDAAGYVQQQVTSSAGAITHTVYVKAVSWTWIRVGIYDSAWKKGYFNISAGTVGTMGAGVTGSIQDVGGGWYRCSVTFTAVGTNVYGGYLLVDADNSDAQAGNSGSNGVYLWGSQIEAGAFSSSYISTTSASATRALDNAKMTGSNFSNWFNASAGTFVIEADIVNTFGQAFSVDDATTNERTLLYWNGSALVAQITDGGTNVVNTAVTGAVSSGTTFKNAYAFELNNFGSSTNGNAVTTDATCTMPSPDRIHIGCDSADSGGLICGHVKSLKFYASRLADATLVTLST